jgi:predicted ATPase
VLPTDATLLLQALEKNDVAEAARLYTGAFLADLYLPDWSSELEEWVYSTREFLAERVRAGLLALAEAEAGRGAFASATAYAEQSYKLAGAPAPDPELLGRLYTLFMAGDSPHLHELHKEAQDYDLTLALTQQAARERLLQRAGAFARTSARVAHNLVVATTSFVGRDPELIELAKLLASPDTPLVTITGPGGVGKTRFALQAASGEVSRGVFYQGIYCVSLETLTDPALIPTTIAKTLGFELSGQAEPLTELIGVLKDKSYLLILDNYEQLLAGALVVSVLIKHCPKLKLIVTSRERLNLAEEQVFPLEGLPLPATTLTLEEAHYHDAVQLFIHRAKRRRPEFSLSATILPHLVEISRLVGGSPLGLELAAAWVHVLSPEDIAREIASNLDFLTATTRNPTERHASLRAAFESSWQLLTLKERGVLRKLSVFVGGFSREAASAVAGATIPLLASLVDKSFLRVLENGRYDRHPLVHQYTAEKLAEHPDEAQLVGAKHAAYFLAFAEQAEHEQAAQARRLERLEKEYTNLQAALAWTLASADLTPAKREAGLRLTTCLYRFWYYRSHFREGYDWLNTALSKTVGEPTLVALRSRALHAAGVLADELGETAQAVQHFEERLRLARDLGDKAGEAAALNSLGIVAQGQQEYARAQALFEASLELRRTLGQPLAVPLGNLGLVALARQEYEQARHFFGESLAISEAAGDMMGVAVALSNLSGVSLEQQDAPGARDLLERAIHLYQELGDKDGVAHCLEGFAEVAALQARAQEAARFAGAAEALRETIGAVLSEADKARHARRLAQARVRLDPAVFARAWSEGQGLHWEAAVRQATSRSAEEHHG